MEGLKLIPYIALVIAIAGIIIGAGVITTSKFTETMPNGGCFNSSYTISTTTNVEPGSNLVGTYCTNATQHWIGTHVGEDALNLSNAGFAGVKATEAQGDLAEQLPTVAIIAIMVIIISIIAGVFVYMRYFA